jgi:hypothetical protein
MPSEYVTPPTVKGYGGEEAPPVRTADAVKLASQPSEKVPLQLPKPPSQPVTWHVLAMHVLPVAFAGVPQTLPQAPQLFASLARSRQDDPQRVSPALQAKPQVPLEQTGLPPAGAEHALPQEPQLATLLPVSVSQPGLPSQSAKPAEQVVWHTPALQVAVPFEAVQTLPHAPQSVGEIARFVSQPSTKLPSQSAYVPEQTATTHIPALQVLPVAFGGVTHA